MLNYFTYIRMIYFSSKLNLKNKNISFELQKQIEVKSKNLTDNVYLGRLEGIICREVNI